MAKLYPYVWRTSTLTALSILLAMLGLSLFAYTQLNAIWHSRLEQRLTSQVQALAQDTLFAETVAATVAGITAQTPDTPDSSHILSQSLQQTAALMAASAVVTDPQGRVLVATAGAAEPGTDLSRMPEIRAALAADVGINVRDNGPDQARTYFVAALVYSGEESPGIAPTGRTPVGILRLALPYAPLQADLRPLQWLVLTAIGVVTLIMLAATLFLTERSAHSLQRLTGYARRLAAGNLDAHHLLSINRSEFTELAHALNRTGDRLKSQLKKRAREKDRLVTIIHVMTDGVIILNKSGRVRLLNPAAERILQTTQARALGRTFVQTARDHRIAELWERCQRSGEEIIATVELGAHQYVRVAMTPFLKRTARGYLVILDDLTEVRRLQTIRQDFVSNVSHELRTPLASLRALVETLRDGALDDPPAAHRFLDRMEVEVDTLTQMVAELLELSRIESGQVPLQLARCRPADILGIGAERLRPQTERASITLRVDIPDTLPEIVADTSRIQQVVTNLIHNAIKFTPPKGTITMTAFVGVRHTSQARRNDEGGPVPDVLPHFVIVKVQDTGLGIAEHELSRIFERFYKTDRSRAMGGTGLGLAISKHIVQAHGGEIWAESDGKHGSTFYFSLPIAPADVIESPATQTPVGELPASSQLSTPLPANGSTTAKTGPLFG